MSKELRTAGTDSLSQVAAAEDTERQLRSATTPGPG
jgi:hypothetical protein